MSITEHREQLALGAAGHTGSFLQRDLHERSHFRDHTWPCFCQPCSSCLYPSCCCKPQESTETAASGRPEAPQAPGMLSQAEQQAGTGLISTRVSRRARVTVHRFSIGGRGGEGEPHPDSQCSWSAPLFTAVTKHLPRNNLREEGVRA